MDQQHPPKIAAILENLRRYEDPPSTLWAPRFGIGHLLILAAGMLIMLIAACDIISARWATYTEQLENRQAAAAPYKKN